MKYVVGTIKVLWTIVKIITIPVGAIALFMQYALTSSIGYEKSLDLKIKMYEEAKTILAEKISKETEK